jgi:pimeloyl-ACP methyl ester carboxylesterase
MDAEGWRFTWFLRWALLAALLFPVDARAADADGSDEIPAPEDIQLQTKDGLRLHAIFYGGTQKKNSVPIIVLHAYNGDCHDFDDLALMLQKQGHSVIAPDLRGHGESLEIDRGGSTEKIETSSLRAADLADMVKYDLEAVKTFLTAKNNAGELNIDKLCVVGAEMGAIIAADWAQLDWSWPVLSTGKQGQDVKALVLISPESNFKGMKLIDAINAPDIRSQLAVLLIAGRKNGRYSEEVNKLYKHFTRYHVEKSSPKIDKLLPETKLQGAKLLGEKSLGVESAISKFVAALVKRPYPWAERRSVLE